MCAFLPLSVSGSGQLSCRPGRCENFRLTISTSSCSHELAHLRRGDDWTNLIQKIVRALFFFHPAVWWIENRLSVEREMACDDAVLAETANPHGYASCLVSLLEKSLAHRLSHKQWSMAQAAVHRAREASLRLAQILDTNRPVATRVWRPALGMVGSFSVVCLVASAARAPVRRV